MDQPLNYHKTVAFEGEAARALKIARGGFKRCSFLFGEETDQGFTVTGPGLHNSRHNPLYAVSWARVRVEGGRIELQARFGGLRTIQRFVYGVMLAFLILFLVTHGIETDSSIMDRMIKPVLPIASGFVIFPLMLCALHRNTKKNLDTMIGNMQVLGKLPDGKSPENKIDE